jgi:hypothetical protein
MATGCGDESAKTNRGGTIEQSNAKRINHLLHMMDHYTHPSRF